MSQHSRSPRSNAGCSALFAWLLAVRRRIDEFRIREHLRRTERELRAVDTGHLDPVAHERRTRQLDRLRDYWRAGAFPTNDATESRAPQFVGANDVPCAIAALLVADGREELVRAVATTDNGVRVEDLSAGPILEWLDANGLSQAEAARIQPAYLPIPPIGVEFAGDCGPVSCATARLLLSTLAVSGFALGEYVGYRLVGDVFPDNPFRRWSVFAYVTVLNLVFVPLLAVVCYALLP